ncbi:AI-2E family transporter [Roseomonas elaeocarpi]|uniref:AI-2E family transporter n=1 Tax=Roseomonas elaeocarpi TaxID=907779 RepID=A0ABV6JT32_9PROT
MGSPLGARPGVPAGALNHPAQAGGTHLPPGYLAGAGLPQRGPQTATRGQRIGLLLGAVAALLVGIWLFSPILTPFVLAGCIAYFLDPPTTRLARLGVPRGFASFLMILAVCAVALVALLLLYPLLISQAGVLLQRLPAYAARIGEGVRDLLAAASERLGPDVLNSRLQDLAVNQTGAILGYVATTAAQFVGGASGLLSVGYALFTYAVVTPVVGFYLLRDWPRMVLRVESWLPRRYTATARSLGRDMDRVLSAWLRGQLICCGLLAVYYAVALQAVGLELGLLVGLLSGLLSFIPYVGSMTGLVTALLLALGQFGAWQGVALVAGVFVFGQMIEGYVIYPRLLGDRVELHAVWVIFALFAGGVAFGFLGVLLAVPMAAAIGVVARHWLRRYLASPLYLDPPRTGTGA